MILFFREIGFSLAEIGRFIAGERPACRRLIDHKLAELAEQQHRIEVARTALEHGRRCPAGEPMTVPAVLVDHRRAAARPLAGGKPRGGPRAGPLRRSTPNERRAAMKIVDAAVVVTSPGRNFVTLKITTDEG